MTLDANRQLLADALRRTGRAERTALQTVYRLTAAKLFGVALRILGERSEAEDVLQEVYVSVWRKAAEFDPDRASPMTWLITITRNRAIDRLRADKRSRALAPLEAAADVADGTVPADQLLERAETGTQIDGCLGELAVHERTALRGAFFDGNTYEELAARMDVPLGTMKSWIRRALIKLRTCLER